MDPEIFVGAMQVRYDQRTQRIDALERLVHALRAERNELLADTDRLQSKEEVTRAGEIAVEKALAIPEILSLILQQLNIVDLLKGYLVCRFWKQAIESNVTLQRTLHLEPDYECAVRTISPHVDTAELVDAEDFSVTDAAQFRLWWLIKGFDRPVGKLMQQAFVTQPPVQHMTITIGCCELGTRQLDSDATDAANGIRIAAAYEVATALKEHARYCSRRLVKLATHNYSRNWLQASVVIDQQQTCASLSRLEARIQCNHRDREALSRILTTNDTTQSNSFNPVAPGPGLDLRAAIMQNGSLAHLVDFRP